MLLQLLFWMLRVSPGGSFPRALSRAEDHAPAIDAFLAKKLMGKTPDRKELKKVADALARRGFSWAEIDEAIRRYEVITDEF